MTHDDQFMQETNFDEIIQVHYFDKEIISIFLKVSLK